MLPLALYLMTFIAAFSTRDHGSARWWGSIAPVVVLLVLVLALGEVRYPILPITFVHLIAFTVLAMLCHTRLAGATNAGNDRRMAASPNSDAVQEMRVETSNFDASQGPGPTRSIRSIRSRSSPSSNVPTPVRFMRAVTRTTARSRWAARSVCRSS